MIRFAANLSMMFTEWPFLDRFEAAAAAGFKAVEFLFPYEFPADAIAARLQEFGLTQALFNLPPGDWAAGERGIAVFPERFTELKAGVEKAIDYAGATGAKRLHLMAGLADAGDAQASESYRRAVVFASEKLAEQGLDLLLEPINARSIPGYFLNDFSRAEHLIAKLDANNVKLQFDVFHRQILHGDITESFRRLLPLIGHIQIASVPARHEPDDGEVNFPFFFKLLEASTYSGFVGCEYNPAARTLDGLAWFNAYRER
jgi:hydroxypyruvate isomerase